MKKAINVWSFPSEYNLHRCMEVAKDAGFSCLEPALSETGELSIKSTDKEVLRIKQMADDTSMELTSLASSLYWTYSLTSNDLATREKGVSIIKRQLEVASLLGVKTILVVPGCVNADFASPAGVDYEVAYDRALEAIGSVADYARECDVIIGLENVWNKFLLSPLEMRDFIDKIHSEYVGMYFDIGNVLLTGYPEQWIRILNKRIVNMHIKDFKSSIGNMNGFVDLLAGDVDFKAVMGAIKDIGYDSYLIAEMGGYKQAKDQIIYNTSAAMDRIFKL